MWMQQPVMGRTIGHFPRVYEQTDARRSRIHKGLHTRVLSQLAKSGIIALVRNILSQCYIRFTALHMASALAWCGAGCNSYACRWVTWARVLQ